MGFSPCGLCCVWRFEDTSGDIRGRRLQLLSAGIRNAINAFLGADDLELAGRFFGGWRIARTFHAQAYSRDSVASGGDEIIMPRVGQSFNSEQVLRLTVDSVSMPYESNYPPLKPKQE
jgi:hypothetical protein